MPIDPVDLRSVLVIALINPAVLIIAFWLGRRADQWQKLPVAAFAAALAGLAFVYIAARLRMPVVSELGRAAAGVFTAQFVFGLVWASVGFYIKRRGL
jgi:hypothetical protein